jgi:predicted phage terminase large subunit-like protein
MANAKQTTLKQTDLTARLMEAFAVTYLYKGFDEAKATPEFHREGWALYCSPVEKACIIAPRGHAKSSAFTHVFILASVLFRADSYVVLVSTNEELAIEHLGDIIRELTENEELITDFEIDGFLTTTKTEVIVKFKDGHQFRILARGSGQKMRGRKWRGMRPGLIVCDDLEDDEQVENKERRDKFRRWFNRAVLPSIRRGGKVRVHGTVLHEDSLLARFKKASMWKVAFYKAHEGFDDFSNILWEDQWPESALRDKRQTYIDDYDASGYSQEYLNDPFDNEEAYIKRDWFIPMEAEHFELPMKKCVGVDFAISKKDKANRTSMTVAGQTDDNVLMFIDQAVGRWGTDEIMDEMFKIQEFHEPHCFFVEAGVIWSAIEPILNMEMRVRNTFLNCVPLRSSSDKATRGRSWQKRMKSGACRFNKQAHWYASFESECLRFTGFSDAVLDDQFDSASVLSRGFDDMPLLDEEEFMSDEELDFRHTDPQRETGRSTITGY